MGIGTALPTQRLDVDGAMNLGAMGTGALWVGGSEALWYNGGYFSWGHGGGSNFFQDPIGIGTTDPSGYMLAVNGDAFISGVLEAEIKMFKIDHPLDPANKYLCHSTVESPDMKNLYDGVAVLDAAGEVIVVLPDYFEALNKDYRYQLTCIGGFAPVYIAEEVAGNRFKIAGGRGGLKVSWQITGIRHDASAQANRVPVELDKPVEQRGKYLRPEGYGLGQEYRMHSNQR